MSRCANITKLYCTIILQSVITFHFFFVLFCILVNQVARQQDVHKAGDHHCNSEHSSNGQKWKDQRKIPHYFWGHETGLCERSRGRLCSELRQELSLGTDKKRLIVRQSCKNCDEQRAENGTESQVWFLTETQVCKCGLNQKSFIRLSSFAWKSDLVYLYQMLTFIY